MPISVARQVRPRRAAVMSDATSPPGRRHPGEQYSCPRAHAVKGACLRAAAVNPASARSSFATVGRSLISSITPQRSIIQVSKARLHCQCLVPPRHVTASTCARSHVAASSRKVVGRVPCHGPTRPRTAAAASAPPPACWAGPGRGPQSAAAASQPSRSRGRALVCAGV